MSEQLNIAKRHLKEIDGMVAKGLNIKDQNSLKLMAEIVGAVGALQEHLSTVEREATLQVMTNRSKPFGEGDEIRAYIDTEIKKAVKSLRPKPARKRATKKAVKKAEPSQETGSGSQPQR